MKIVRPCQQKNIVIQLSFFFLIAGIICLSPKNAFAWFDDNWNYRVSITINASEVNANLSSFPVYVDLADLPNDFHTNVKSDGCDIRVLETNDLTQTAFELVEYDSDNDTGELHFLADTVSSSSDITFYIYYGNAEASCYPTDGAFGAENVWISGYAGVWHMNEDPSGATPQILDSTSVSSDGTTGGSMTNGDLVNARVSEGIDFDGIDDEVRVGVIDKLENAYEGTISAWVKMDTFDSRNIIFGQEAGHSYRGSYMYIDTDGVLKHWWRDGSTNQTASGNTEMNLDTWYHVVLTSTGTTYEMYINNSAESVSDNTSGLWFKDLLDGGNSTNSYVIGFITRSNVENQAQMDGAIDEIRVYDTARTVDWISAEYTNQNTPTTFYTVGSQSVPSESSEEIAPRTIRLFEGFTIKIQSGRIILYGAE